jgi:hypothetical protein
MDKKCYLKGVIRKKLMKKANPEQSGDAKLKVQEKNSRRGLSWMAKLPNLLF